MFAETGQRNVSRRLSNERIASFADGRSIFRRKPIQAPLLAQRRVGARTARLLSERVNTRREHCNLKTISDAAWRALAGIAQVFLHGNRLITLPDVAARVIFAVQRLTRQDNSWSCSCDNTRLRTRLQLIQNRLWNGDGIFCRTPETLYGKVILRLTNDEFCIDPALRILAISLSSVGGCLLLLAIAFVTAYRCRVKIH